MTCSTGEWVVRWTARCLLRCCTLLLHPPVHLLALGLQPSLFGWHPWRGCSGGTRQIVQALVETWSDPEFTFATNGVADYEKALRSSKFCLAPYGHGKQTARHSCLVGELCLGAAPAPPLEDLHSVPAHLCPMRRAADPPDTHPLCPHRLPDYSLCTHPIPDLLIVGWGNRLLQAMLAGCVPVIVQVRAPGHPPLFIKPQ